MNGKLWGGIPDLQDVGIDIIDRLAEKRFAATVEAEEAATFVVEKISEDDWKRCKKFNTKSHPKAFLVTAIRNLLEDYSRHKFGRPRPPEWLRALGKLSIELWSELCLERRSIAEVIHRYEQRKFEDIELVKDKSKEIKRELPNCGKQGFEEVNVDDFSSIEGSISEASSLPEQEGLSVLLLLTASLVGADQATRMYQPEKLDKAKELLDKYSSEFAAVRKELVFEDEETIILKMHYIDGVSFTKVAEALNMTRYKAKTIEGSCLERIHKAFTAAGIELESLLRLLNKDD